MKKVYLLFILYLTAYLGNAQGEFVTTWQVEGVDLTMEVPIVEDDDIPDNYTIDFGDGTVLTDQSGTAIHSYDSEGTYTVIISGEFSRIRFLTDLGSNPQANPYASKILTIEQWGNIQWTSMENAFRDCLNLTIPAIDIPNLSNVTDMSRMFMGASSFNQSVGGWDVSGIVNLEAMFYGASSFNQPLNGWDVSSVTNISRIFLDATSFNQPLNNWNVSNVINMRGVFFEAHSFNQPLNDWNTSNVTDMQFMFFGTINFNQSLSAWTFNTNVNLSSFISYVGLDIINYEDLLNRFAVLELENKTLGSEDLKYCNEGVRDNLVNDLGWTIVGDSLSENCNNNILLGTVLYDSDNDGCDISDIPLINFIINIDNEIDNYSTITNNEGGYSLNELTGVYDVTLLNVPSSFEVTPATSQVTFTGSGNIETLDFCLTAIEIIEDLNITLLPITDARPGFEAKYQLIVENMGTQTVANATINLTFDEAMQTFVTAEPEATVTTASQLTFEIENLQPFASSTIDITMETFTPPTVNGGDFIGMSTTITPHENDNTPWDNLSALKQEVVNSYDPNDKRVVQGAEITPEQAEDYLDYIIRFQNTGSASAITVRVEDDLHENLDWTTFKVISSSHDYRVEITDGSHVEFIFEDINLPHEDADAVGSNGYIAYKIKPVADIAIGDIINGDAEIYFDYNLPIITNDAITEVVIPLSTDNHSINNQLSVYPNPVKDVVYIQSDNLTVEELTIYNLQGSQLITAKQNLETINTITLSTGIYLLHIQTNKGLAKYKLVKN